MRRKPWVRWILVADLLWIAFAFTISVMLRYGLTLDNENAWTAILHLTPLVLWSGIAWVVFSVQLKLDGFGGGWHFPAVVSRVLLAVSAFMTVLLALGYLLHELLSRLVFSYFGALLLTGFILIRYCTRVWLHSRYGRAYISRVIVLGSGRVAQELARKIARHPEMLCEVVGFLSPCDSLQEDSATIPAVYTPLNLSPLGIVEFLRDQKIDQIVIALSRPVWPEVLKVMDQCREHKISVSLIPHPYELYLSRPEFIDLDGLPVLRLQEYSMSNSRLFWKRCLDLVIGGALSLVALPIVLIAASSLKIVKGRAFTWEYRCGQYGKPFHMVRLNVTRGIYQSSLFEHVLETLSITELPQLWNVLRGDMSLVGPRPETPQRVKHYTEWHQQRLTSMPGITGLAQVHGLREHSSSEEKARFDLQYLLNPTPFGDLSLLLQTTWTLAMRLARYNKLKRKKRELADVEGLQEQPFVMEAMYSAHSTQPSAD